MTQVNIKEYFKQEMENLRQSVLNPPSLLIIDATDGDAGNQVYIKKKVEDFNSLGWPVEVSKPKDANELKLDLEFAEKNRDIDCVIVQMPTADRFNFSVDMLPANKDCDGLHPMSKVTPATVRGVIDYLDKCEFPYSGNMAVVLGRSDIVGKPMAKALLDRDMTVCQCHSKTSPGLRTRLMKEADLIITAVGKPHFFNRKNCGSHAVVIDVGISRDENDHLIGDFQESQDLNPMRKFSWGWSTPVPGGVGLLTRLGLIKNCLDLIKEKEQYKQITMEEWEAEYRMRPFRG